MEFLPKFGSHVSTKELKGHILVLPSVSYGNLGQLAIDLIINTLLNYDGCQEEGSKDCDIVHIGYMISPSTAPLAGGYAFTKKPTANTSNITVNLELYQIPSKNVLILQQRTPIIQNKMMNYANELVEWASAVAINGIYVIAGANDMYHMPLTPTQQSNFGIVLSPRQFDDRRSQYHNAEFIKQFLIKVEDMEDTTAAIRKRWQGIRGAGVAAFLDKVTCTANMPFASLVMTCTEGHNVTEAVELAALVWSFLQLPNTRRSSNDSQISCCITDSAHRFFTFPPSWHQMFGKESDSSLYY